MKLPHTDRDLRKLVDAYVAEHGVKRCPSLMDGSERERLERQDKQIARAMSRAATKGWVKRASRGRTGRL